MAQINTSKPVPGLLPIQRITTGQENNGDFVSPKTNDSSALVTTVPTGTSTEVGITEGQLSVTLSGAANYSIPIAVPPGINGVVPQINLTYNSQSGNGLAGFGWNVGGISGITKVASTKFHDNNIDGVDFDNLDRFSFDGQRLLLKSGTYGADGAVYETENYSNIKITSIGIHPSGSNYGPAYFLVQYADGSFAYYGNATGNTSNSRSLTDYVITYWQNPQGVRINYYYTLVNNTLSISNIKYGTAYTATEINDVQFIYKTRQRPEQAYIGGQNFSRNTILSEIRVIGNGVGYRNYVLSHNTTSLGYERLISITEKTGDLTKSYNPTVFNYDDTIDLISYTPTTTTLSLANISVLNAATVAGDYDGDGKMDFALYPTTGVDMKTKFWLFSNVDGSSSNMGYGPVNIGTFIDLFSTTWINFNNKFMPMQAITAIQKSTSVPSKVNFNVFSKDVTGVYLQYSREFQWTNYTTPPVTTGSYKTGVDGIYLNGDFNGDGITDVVIIRYKNKIRKCLRNACLEYADVEELSTEKDVYFLNLDQRLTSGYSNLAGILTDNLTLTSKFFVADTNGDGKSDFMIFENGKVTVYGLNNSNQLVTLSTYPDLNITVATDKTILLGDYNGDGKTDFIIPKGQAYFDWYKYISTGSTFTKTTDTYSGFNYAVSDSANTRYLIPTDLNNDGKTDLVRVTCSRNSADTLGHITVNCVINVNGLFNFSTANNYLGNSGLQSDIDKYALPIFYNSNQINKKMEIACVNGSKIHYFQSQKDFNVERLVKSIVTGNGVTETITYKPLVQESCSYNCFFNYIPANSVEIYPNRDVNQSPTFEVVTKLEKQSASVYKKQLFSYYGLTTNFEGLGSFGFRAISRTNWHDDNTQVISTVSKADISLRGAMTEVYTALGKISPVINLTTSDPFITKSYNTYNIESGNFVNPLQANKVYKLKITSNQTYKGLENTSEESSILFDTYNNPTQNTSIVKEGTSTIQTTITDIVYDNQPTGSIYYIGRPNSKTQSVAVTGDTMTSQELYFYNTSNLLSQIKKKGHLTNFVTEDNIYDPVGNITKKTTTAVGLTPRVTNYEYDVSGRFMNKSFDIEGLLTQFDYNTSSGVLNYEINPYGLKTSFEYDKWFKKTKIIDYLLKNTIYTYTKSNENTIIAVAGDDGSNSEEVFDDLGRKTKSGVKNISGVWSYVSIEYDIYDRAKKVSEPYFGASPSQWSETMFDVYGRLSQNNSYTGKIITLTYVGLTSTISDGLKSKTTIKNALDYTTKVTDAPGGIIDYTYFANGNAKNTVYGNTTITVFQDGWGRKTKLIDPSAGTYQYEYNEFGEITKEITPNGTTTFALDNFGKLTTKTIIGSLTNNYIEYQYDAASKLLTLEDGIDIEGNDYSKQYFYDAQKRLITTYESESSSQYFFEKRYEYDGFGRLFREYYNSESLANAKKSFKWVKHTYLNGYHWQILDDATSNMLWQVDEVNARGQLVTANYGNAVGTESHTYDIFGLPAITSFRTVNGTYASTTPFMSLTTVFNPQRGILNSRSNSMFSWNETFQYDNLDRLTEFTDGTGAQTSQSYNDIGTIDTNATGTYAYTVPNKPYQVSTVTLNGANNVNYYTARNPQQVSYNAFKSPISINEEGVERIDFAYNQSLSRAIQYYGGTQTDKYARPLRKYFSSDGSMEIKRNLITNTVEFVTYIGGDGYSASIVLKSDGTTQNYFYLHRDYLGSILAITNSSGQLVEKRLFDAWGSLIKYGNIGGVTIVPTQTGSMFLDRGYTGHEHLLGAGLINMNGRLYDPKLHRFLSPDNFVQDPYNTQNYNRYGYVLNNPLMFNDYSGESFGSWWDDNWKTVVTIAAAVAVAAIVVASCGTAVPLLAVGFYSGAAAGFTGGFIGTALNGGTFTDCLVGGGVGAAIGGAMGGIGGFIGVFAPAGAFAGALYGGSTGALLGGFGNMLTGGSFRDGAIMGGVFGAVGGGFVGFKSAKAQGLNPWTGNTIRPKVVALKPLTAGPVTAKPTAQKLPQNSNTPLFEEAPPTQKVYEIVTGADGTQSLAQPIKPATVAYKQLDPNSAAGIKSLDATDLNHYFSNIVDNNMANAAKYTIKSGDGVYRSLYQVEGSLRGKSGIFEWIVEAGGNCTHRVFIPNAKISGIPNNW